MGFFTKNDKRGGSNKAFLKRIRKTLCLLNTSEYACMYLVVMTRQTEMMSLWGYTADAQPKKSKQKPDSFIGWKIQICSIEKFFT
mgnify:CR=1 FL=1